jgi:hypothetical protein
VSPSPETLDRAVADIWTKFPREDRSAIRQAAAELRRADDERRALLTFGRMSRRRRHLDRKDAPSLTDTRAAAMRSPGGINLGSSGSAPGRHSPDPAQIRNPSPPGRQAPQAGHSPGA